MGTIRHSDFLWSSDDTQPTVVLATAFVHRLLSYGHHLHSEPHHILHPDYSNSFLNSLSTLTLLVDGSLLFNAKPKYIWKQWSWDLKASLALHSLIGQEGHSQGSLQSELRNLLISSAISQPPTTSSPWWHQLTIISITCSECSHLNTCYSLQL